MCNIFSCCITAPDCLHDYFKSLPITFIILNGIASFENVAVTVLSDEKENIKGVALSIYLSSANVVITTLAKILLLSELVVLLTMTLVLVVVVVVVDIC